MFGTSINLFSDNIINKKKPQKEKKEKWTDFIFFYHLLCFYVSEYIKNINNIHQKYIFFLTNKTF